LAQMLRLKNWLVSEPISRRRTPAASPRYRSRATADAILGTVCEFFRFCTLHGFTEPGLLKRFFEPQYLRYLPPGFDPGEDGQFRTVRSRAIRFGVPEKPFEFLEPERIDRLVAETANPRDRFLVALLATTGLRIGEALGLRRQDMHFLADSRVVGCDLRGPHLHVRRREDNPNGALAKSRFPRSIPVPEQAISFYSDYAHERDLRLGATDLSPMVFVNLYRPPLGRALSYQSCKAMFDRLQKTCGIVVHPHLLRHTAATVWLRQGASRDTVQNLLGHASPTSMQPYLHPGHDEQRIAVERAAAWTRNHQDKDPAQ
jgi:integrase/recombinase XerD